MEKLRQIEREHLDYADVILQFIERPRSNEQLVDLIKQVVSYLQYASEELHMYNEYIDTFIRVSKKLP